MGWLGFYFNLRPDKVGTVEDETFKDSILSVMYFFTEKM
jgi:hypothetical protein